MNRTIKFRGKRLDNDEWVYGYYVEDGFINICSHNEDDFLQYNIVDPDTVGQFTGLLDRNGKEIYEGDILQWTENGHKSNPMEVVVKYGAFGYLYYGFHSLVGNTNFTFYLKGTDSRFEIIGNIHDNPELMKQ